jgi:hypothetical protein
MELKGDFYHAARAHHVRALEQKCRVHTDIDDFTHLP